MCLGVPDGMCCGVVGGALLGEDALLCHIPPPKLPKSAKKSVGFCGGASADGGAGAELNPPQSPNKLFWVSDPPNGSNKVVGCGFVGKFEALDDVKLAKLSFEESAKPLRRSKFELGEGFMLLITESEVVFKLSKSTASTKGSTGLEVG